MTKAGPQLPLRRLLRTLDGVEMWHIEDGAKERTPTIRYIVKSNGDENIFERPHLAWRQFQQLTNAPDRDPRPQPPPLDFESAQAEIRQAEARETAANALVDQPRPVALARACNWPRRRIELTPGPVGSSPPRRPSSSGQGSQLSERRT